MNGQEERHQAKGGAKQVEGNPACAGEGERAYGVTLGLVSQAQLPTSAQTEKEIVKLEQQLPEAGNRGDVGVAEKCLAPNYELTTSAGTMANREQAHDSIRKQQQRNMIGNIYKGALAGKCRSHLGIDGRW